MHRLMRLLAAVAFLAPGALVGAHPASVRLRWDRTDKA